MSRVPMLEEDGRVEVGLMTIVSVGDLVFNGRT